MTSKLIAALSLLIATGFATCSLADDALPKLPERFDVAGNTAMVYAAPKPAPGRPWVWYAPTIKGLSLAGRKAYFEGFLNAGIGIAGYDLGEVRGAPASTAKFTQFYDEMVRRGWSPRPAGSARRAASRRAPADRPGPGRRQGRDPPRG